MQGEVVGGMSFLELSIDHPPVRCVVLWAAPSLCWWFSLLHRRFLMSCNWLVNSLDFLASLGLSQKVPVCGVYIESELFPWYFSPEVSETQVLMKVFGPLWLDFCTGPSSTLEYPVLSSPFADAFYQHVFWHLEIRWLSLYRFISRSSPAFHWSTCLYLCQYHDVSVTIAL